MRTTELLNALAEAEPGIGCTVTSGSASVTTLYAPPLKGEGTTLFAAAFQLAKKLTAHSQCPSAVNTALHMYDRHTERLI